LHADLFAAARALRASKDEPRRNGAREPSTFRSGGDSSRPSAADGNVPVVLRIEVPAVATFEPCPLCGCTRRGAGTCPLGAAKAPGFHSYAYCRRPDANDRLAIAGLGIPVSGVYDRLRQAPPRAARAGSRSDGPTPHRTPRRATCGHRPKPRCRLQACAPLDRNNSGTVVSREEEVVARHKRQHTRVFGVRKSIA
jgi:hypothetical protein